MKIENLDAEKFLGWVLIVIGSLSIVMWAGRVTGKLPWYFDHGRADSVAYLGMGVVLAIIGAILLRIDIWTKIRFRLAFGCWPGRRVARRYVERKIGGLLAIQQDLEDQRESHQGIINNLDVSPQKALSAEKRFNRATRRIQRLENRIERLKRLASHFDCHLSLQALQALPQKGAINSI